ncbi:MAG TPA: hypothetical protein VGI63_09950, partial [Verrucomicrobiae bacterium]
FLGGLFQPLVNRAGVHVANIADLDVWNAGKAINMRQAAAIRADHRRLDFSVRPNRSGRCWSEFGVRFGGRTEITRHAQADAGSARLLQEKSPIDKIIHRDGGFYETMFAMLASSNYRKCHSILLVIPKP